MATEIAAPRPDLGAEANKKYDFEDVFTGEPFSTLLYSSLIQDPTLLCCILSLLYSALIYSTVYSSLCYSTQFSYTQHTGHRTSEPLLYFRTGQLGSRLLGNC